MAEHTRSNIMRRIRGTDTDPEVTLRRALWHRGLRYRLRYRTSAGRPDLTFIGARVAVYIDGCFWHGCPEHYVAPRTSQAFWRTKLHENVSRDRRQTLTLEREGWTVLRFWEHEVYTDLGGVLETIQTAIAGDRDQRKDSWRVASVQTVDPERDLEERHLEDLRDASRSKTVTRVRSTDKW